MVAYLLGTDEGTEVFEALMRGPLSAPVREVGMSYQQRWMDQGRAEGRAEGEAKGRAEGEAKGRAEGEAKGRAEVLLKLLRLRFAEPSADVETRVREASIEELDRWVERVLSAESLEDVFA